MYAYSTYGIGEGNTYTETPLFRIVNERQSRIELAESSSAYLERSDGFETLERIRKEQLASISSWLPQVIQHDEQNSNSNNTTQQVQKNLNIIRLLNQWLEEDSNYDEEVWPVIKESLENNRLSSRRRFHE